ncbi:MAG: radical SAM protein [Deltaproteobacteria bacterium]|nr:radical SAM protein [Deltaproteobacteria bacterium]
MIQYKSLLTNARYMMNHPKPKLIARTVKGYAATIISRKPRLRYADIIVHYGCNMQCEHCSCESLKDDSRRRLNPAEWGDVAKQCSALGVLTFGVQGGEPLIYKDLEEVIHNLDPNENFISIKTNGTVASKELFDKLRKIGVDSITVGFGPVPNEYDFSDYDKISRKLKDAFSLSLRTVKMIGESGIKPMMSVVIGRHNIGSNVFRGMINLAKECDSVLTCALAVPVGAWELNYDIMLNDSDRKYLNWIMRENPHVRTDFQTNWLVEGCGALKEKIYISPYGDVLPCPFIQISFGNILEEPLEIIWKRGCQVKAFSEYAPVCLAAEDRKFLSYLEISINKGKKLPISYNDPDIQSLLNTYHKERINE